MNIQLNFNDADIEILSRRLVSESQRNFDIIQNIRKITCNIDKNIQNIEKK
ncbi:MAG: hypothetical protein WCJ19_00655 [bacterium]